METEQNINNGSISTQSETQSQPTPVAGSYESRVAEYHELNSTKSEGSDSVDVSKKDSKPSVDVETKATTTTEKPAEKKHESGWERRNRILKQKNDALIKRLEALEQKINAPTQAATTKEKEPHEYDSYAEYLKDIAKSQAQTTLNETLREQSERFGKEQSQQEAINNFKKDWAGRTKSLLAPEEMSEFTEMFADGWNPEEEFTPEALEYIEQSPVGPKMMYELGKNPEYLAMLKQYKGIGLAAKLLQIEQVLAGGVKPTQQTTESKPAVSKAPHPTGEFSGQGGAGATTDDDLIARYKRLNPR